VSDVIGSSSSSYGNPGMGSCGVDIVSEGVGVIGFGDKGVGGVGVVVVTFFIVFGIPHIFDSVVLTNLSFGLLGSQSFDFSAGETVVAAYPSPRFFCDKLDTTKKHKKLQQWIVDLINWSIYTRYRNLN
jgi:hypothetical protein